MLGSSSRSPRFYLLGGTWTSATVRVTRHLMQRSDILASAGHHKQGIMLSPSDEDCWIYDVRWSIARQQGGRLADFFHPAGGSCRRGRHEPGCSQNRSHHCSALINVEH